MAWSYASIVPDIREAQQRSPKRSDTVSQELQLAAANLEERWRQNKAVGHLINDEDYKLAVRDYEVYTKVIGDAKMVLMEGEFPSTFGKVWNPSLPDIFANPTVIPVYAHLMEYGIAFGIFDYVPIRPLGRSKDLVISKFLDALWADKGLLDATMAFRTLLYEFWEPVVAVSWGAEIRKLLNDLQASLNPETPDNMPHTSLAANRGNDQQLRRVIEALDSVVISFKRSLGVSCDLEELVAARKTRDDERMINVVNTGVDAAHLKKITPSAIYSFHGIWPKFF